MVVLLLGAPGSGKGTQSKFINQWLKVPVISTGDMLRAEIEGETPLGLVARQVLASGGLVDDDLVNAMVVQRLHRPDCQHGFILDGYPRTVPQAKFLSQVIAQKNLPRPQVIHLDVPVDVLVTRLASRRQCPTCHRVYNLLTRPPRRDQVCDDDLTPLTQRNDDEEQVVRQRLEAYQRLCAPLLKYYAGPDYHKIDGLSSPEEIRRRIHAALKVESNGARP